MLKVADIEHIYDAILITVDVLSISGPKLCVLLGKTKKASFCFKFEDINKNENYINDCKYKLVACEL